MASSYTTNFGIEEMATGDQSGDWGTTTNFNFDILDRITAYKAVALSDASTATLTVREASPGSGTENLQDGMFRVIKFTGSLSQNCTITIAPNTTTAFFVFIDGTSGGFSLIFSQGSGANYTLASGTRALVYCDGAGSGAVVAPALVEPLTTRGDIVVRNASNLTARLAVGSASNVVLTDGTDVSWGQVSLTAGVTGTLPVANGGTGATSLTDGGVLLGSGTGAVTALAVLADSEMIVGDGSTDPVAESGATLRTSIGVGTGDSPQFTAVNIGAATDTTLARSGAGDLTVEGNAIYRAGGTDVPVADGGTGASSLTDGGVLLGSGTGAITAMSVLSDGQMIVGDGSTDPVAESGATLRTSIGVGTGDSPQFTAVNIGAATDTTLARSGAGDLTVEGNAIYRAGGTDVPVADGGTGASTLTANSVLLGNGTSALQMIAPSTSGNVLTSDGSTWASAAAGGGGSCVWLGSQVVTTGSEVTFTSLIDDSVYFAYKWHLYIAPDSASKLLMQFSEDNGSSYVSSNYIWQLGTLGDVSGANDNWKNAEYSNGDSAIRLTMAGAQQLDSTTGRYLSMEITMEHPECPGTTSYLAQAQVVFDGFINSGGQAFRYIGVGNSRGAGLTFVVDAVKFKLEVDNSTDPVDFRDCFIHMYGFKNSA